MEVFDEASYPTDAPAVAVSVGVYDGVHLGHRHVLSRLRSLAEARSLPTLVVTFDPHPASVVDKDRAPLLLCPIERRLELLEELGINRCLVVGFDPDRARQAAEGFVDRVLVDLLHAALVVVGENFRFGHDRAGDVELLRSLSFDGGFEVEPVALDALGGEPVTSSRIRAAVSAGDVDTARTLLGRPHEIEGVVVRGAGRGRTIGYPTANLEVQRRLCIPDVGIYAGTWTRPGGERHVAAISIGRRPTFLVDGDVLIEAHLCDFSDDLYGEPGRIGFVSRLRAEARFESVDALVQQIALDVEATRAAVGR
jgi:riboflavin kinase/FMN adenylyltransferase